MVDKTLRRPQVEELVGLSRSTLYEMMSRGEFPRPLRIGKRAVAWKQSTVIEWLSQRPRAGNGAR